MKQTIRAIGWATNIFWIVLLFFTVTAVYSATKIGLQFSKPTTAATSSGMTMSFPMSINNGGFYDISRFNITTRVTDNNGYFISDSSTFIQVIPRGHNVSLTHNLSVNITQLANSNLSHLLFNDSNLDVALSLNLNYANAVPFEISTNITMPWGAPLANANLGNASFSPYNSTCLRVTLPLSFENHSSITLDGSILIEIVNDADQVVGKGKTTINVQAGRGFGNPIQLLVSGSPASIKAARLYFETSVFNYGPMVIPLV